MSSGRSRSGGMCIGMTFSLKKRSSWSLPRLMRSFGFRLVAAMMRVSKRTVSPEPSGSNRATTARTSLACVWRFISPISSRKSVPPSARRSLPFLSLRAWGAWPLSRAEQLVFDDVVGDGRAVDLDEPLVLPQALLMDEPGGQLLAGSVFARDQHPAVGRRDLSDLLAEPPDRVALPHEV